MLQTVQTRIGPLTFENGYPSAETLTRLYDELDFQRACQAYVWATPIVALDALRLANQRDWGVDDNEVGLAEDFANPGMEALTANASTIYAVAFVDLRRDGPVVIDSPAEGYGVIDDYWQRPIVEIGPFGPDRGQGGRFLLLPPGYAGDVPDGYHVAPSPTNRAIYLVRGLVRGGDVQRAVDTLRKVRIYPLRQAAAPPPTRIVEASHRPLHSIAPAGFEYWERLAAIVQHEPVEARDRFFMAMLRPLGIEPGKPFAPDPRQRQILTDAAVVGFDMAQAISVAPRFADVVAYPGTHWERVITVDPAQEAATYSELDERTDYTFEAITMAAGMVEPVVGAGSQYLSAARDRDGAWLDGGKTYRLRVPPNVPVEDFWSVTVYDNLTRSMIQTDTNRASLGSQDLLEATPDGSIDLHFGPAPPVAATNWIKTVPGRGWFVYFRWYGPTEAFFDKRWRLPDLELDATS